MRYMVMETHLAYAVVLGQDGSVLKVANRRYQVGETVNDIIPMKVTGSADASEAVNRTDVREIKMSGRGRALKLMAVSAAAVLMFGAWGIYDFGFATYGSVYMTINPEVRIDMSRSDRIVDIDGINEDGEALVSGYNYSGKSLSQVIEELGVKAASMGYLERGGEIGLRIESESDRWTAEQQDELIYGAAERLSDSLKVTIEINGTEDTVVAPPETEPVTTAPETSAPEPETWVIEIPEVTPEPVETAAETTPAPAPLQTPASTQAPAPTKPPALAPTQTQSPVPQPVPHQGDSGYGNSNYGDSAYGTSGHGSLAYGDSGYDGSGYGESGYDD